MSAEDTRRDRMDLGPGLWNDNVARYYPLSTIRTADGFILDELDSRPVLIVFDQSTGVPATYYMEAAHGDVHSHDNAHANDDAHAHAHGDHIHFDNGLTFAGGRFTDANGDLVKPDRPLQLFTRWYGFSFTFPDCELYQP